MNKKNITILALVIVFAGLFIFSGYREGETESEPQEFTDISNSVVEKARVSLRNSLKDPDSAIFEYIYPSSQHDDIACGMVNAKNSYGGYTGKKKFIVNINNDTVVIDSDSELFSSKWDEFCDKSKPMILLK
ncbi:hypothetical protein [Xenorhabdus bovienii]|uniref:hypothetical protein n=1 Tax=Xenorhabdus bovienii TaxID=40576 RepID=UPI0023B2DAA7|nr:hypothetical protein [Xenorhabdus bovienii]MDE9429658.1 hypothetical protein [Xenorhabdus bovienii]MDE9463418.1 hypothetical protein [Xenorhabdus bovienii]MDE9471114.1 hypothetical protein [Xenorhabdus bovienii]MDE9484251.1 hypothetical protein [Xenorhabdus bovienii]MDE9557629.1 hypothetical protein [Xenorhabdus bovienii]